MGFFSKAAVVPTSIGAFCLLASFVLLLVCSITVPTVKHLGFIHMYGLNGAALEGRFGTFGYCTNVYGCYRGVGYKFPPAFALVLGGSRYAKYLPRLSHALILHPIAAAFAFFAFIATLIRTAKATVVAAILGNIAFLCCLVVWLMDFTLFFIFRREIRNHSTVVGAEIGGLIWLPFVSTILLFISNGLVLFGFCAARRHKKKKSVVGTSDRDAEKNGYNPTVSRDTTGTSVPLHNTYETTPTTAANTTHTGHGLAAAGAAAGTGAYASNKLNNGANTIHEDREHDPVSTLNRDTSGATAGYPSEKATYSTGNVAPGTAITTDATNTTATNSDTISSTNGPVIHHHFSDTNGAARFVGEGPPGAYVTPDHHIVPADEFAPKGLNKATS